MDLAAEFIDRHKEKAIASLKTRVQAPRDNARQAKVTLFIDRHAEYYILDQSLCACDGLFLCLSRKRPSQVSPRRLKSALGLPRLRTAPKPTKIELFSLGLWRASDTK